MLKYVVLKNNKKKKNIYFLEHLIKIIHKKMHSKSWNPTMNISFFFLFLRNLFTKISLKIVIIYIKKESINIKNLY